MTNDGKKWTKRKHPNYDAPCLEKRGYGVTIVFYPYYEEHSREADKKAAKFLKIANLTADLTTEELAEAVALHKQFKGIKDPADFMESVKFLLEGSDGCLHYNDDVCEPHLIRGEWCAYCYLTDLKLFPTPEQEKANEIQPRRE